MKKGILTRIFGGGRLAVPLALAAVSSAAQTPLERELLSSGFENVRQLKGETGSYVFLEPVPFRSMRDAVDAVTGRIGAAGDSAGGPMTVVWTEDRIPKFVLETGGYPDSVRWRLDFDTRDAREAWKRSLTSRPGAKRFLRSSAGRVDLILYPQFRFRNSRLDVMYEVQINLNPTLEVNLWRGSKLTAQLIVPILNEFYKEESRVRPGYLTLSQRFRLPANVLAKATFGNFSMNRWGADLKLFKPVGRHFGIYAEAGLTGISYLYFDGWSYAPMSKGTWMAGGNYLWNRFDLMFDVSAARYLGDDIGATAKVTRYFRRAAVGFYVQKTQKVDYNGGFYFALALPPYRIKRRRPVRVAPSRYFEMVYNAKAYLHYGRNYETSPDDNCAENFFNATRYNQIINNYTNH